MRIFALETDLRKLEQQFLSPGEHHILTVFYHWFTFLFRVIGYTLITIVIFGAATAAVVFLEAPWQWAFGPASVLWLILIPYPLARAYIDWQFDFLFLTDTRVIIVDQSFIFRQSILQLNLENFASVTSVTQWLNLFPFGKIVFNLKEGHGERIIMKYVPQSQDVADKISDAVAAFTRENPNFSMQPTALLTTIKDCPPRR